MASLYVAYCGPGGFGLANVTEASEGVIEKLIPHLISKEKKQLELLKSQGYSIPQQVVCILSFISPVRANTLINHLI